LLIKYVSVTPKYAAEGITPCWKVTFTSVYDVGVAVAVGVAESAAVGVAVTVTVAVSVISAVAVAVAAIAVRVAVAVSTGGSAGVFFLHEKMSAAARINNKTGKNVFFMIFPFFLF
jgi:hypothetical protein